MAMPFRLIAPARSLWCARQQCHNYRESLPQARSSEQSNEDEAQNSRNVLLAGTTMVSGEARR